jgi:protein-L-isoaspartate(D-aspartate) O-methyltransferase
MKNSAQAWHSLSKLTIISGLKLAREIMDTLAARQQMVDQQIRTWEVLDPRVLDALSAVPREAFVPPEYRELAFADAPIPIGFGQTMLAPKLQGRILQALGPNATDSALEVGSGTGYLAACLSLLCASTHSIDIHPGLTESATVNLRAVPNARVQFESRDVFAAPPSKEYDVVAVTGSLPVYDTRFERSLRVGGRLFAIIGVAPVMDAILVRRVDHNEWIRESLFETVVEPLINAAAAPRFVF